MPAPQGPEVTIRSLRREDHAAWLPLWQGYRTFYNSVASDAVTAATFARFFDPAEPMHALVAERDGALVGFTHFLFHRSTWMIEPVCYLQDLFTAEAARGMGVGRRLIEAVCEAARQARSERVYWLTQESNATARALYDKVAQRSGFIHYMRPIDPAAG